MRRLPANGAVCSVLLVSSAAKQRVSVGPLHDRVVSDNRNGPHWYGDSDTVDIGLDSGRNGRQDRRDDGLAFLDGCDFTRVTIVGEKGIGLPHVLSRAVSVV